MGRILTLQPGAHVGHYEILTAIGKGGMGEVWKARDTRLRRDVAIKALPDAVAQEPDRLARLEHEAALLASLNHPHIATIHGLEQQDGSSYLVLELVEGNTLEDRLLLGIIRVEEVLMLALQLALALEAAHDKGIVHRDLKPSNIKVTPDKRLKVLDFGIAKALAVPGGNETRTVNPTVTGVISGTPAYMSPEQARGEAVGFQSDVWSFGAVLYEMLTGDSPFKRKTSADTLGSVLEAQPDYAALPPATPVAARRLVQRCLEKDRLRRLRHMQDVRILVEDALASLGSEAPVVSAPAARRRRWWVGGGVAVAALAGALVGFLAHRATPEKPLVYGSIPFTGNPARWPFGIHHLAISHDASTVAFASSTGLQIRRLDQKNLVTIPTGASSSPFFSPDGDWIGVFTGDALAKVPTSGGTPITLVATIDRPTGGAWRADGTIVFATAEGLFEVSADGGERKVLAKPDRSRKETLYAWPQFLPDGRSLLLTVVSEDANEPLQTVRLDLTSRERRTVLRGSSAVYVANGYLIYAAGATLSAVAFDGTTITGKPVSFPEIEVAVAADNGGADFAISDTGTLVFVTPATSALRTLEWIDRRGTPETLPIEPRTYNYPRVSPDGTRVAVERTTSGNRDIWILDLNRLTQTQLTEGPTEDALPVWSTDGRRVFFASNRAGTFDVYSQAADGASSAKLEFGGPEFQAPMAPTPDGTRLIVYDRYQDLTVLDFAKPGRLEPLLRSEFDERLGEVSPDGKWIAYESDESGKQFEIILRSFPNVNERREIVSVNGGRFPRWGPKGGSELYYVAPNGAMMAVPITLSPRLALGRPMKLFDSQRPGPRSGHPYDVAPDGRFLVVRSLAPSPDGQTNVSLILNWAAMLQNRRP